MKVHMPSRRSMQGFSLIELLVALTITLMIVVAASLVYMSVREADSSQSKVSDSMETGTFALQLIGRDIAQAETYPVLMPPTTVYAPIGKTIKLHYPPLDWSTYLSSAPYQLGIFGCDGGTFDTTTATCVASTAMAPYRSAPDSIVINYFSADASNTPAGNRDDCSGADAGNDVVNVTRKPNTVPDAGTPPKPTVEDKNLPPYLPVFVSNRYALNDTTTEIDKQVVTTRSLACNGNGMNGSIPGDAKTANIYYPILLGVEDLQITYGVSPLLVPGSTAMNLTPDRFYKASEVAALGDVKFEEDFYQPWARVTAVRVCMMTRTLGGSSPIQDKSGAARTYLDCTDDTPQSYAANDTSTRKRHVQVFALRNRLTQAY